MRRAFAFLAVLALAAAAARPARARRALTPPAPELPEDAAWINALPFSLAQLREKRVVLLAFFDSANINSLRALPTLEAWDRAWSLKGLMIIGVHAPLFSSQKDPSALREALRRRGVHFPVVLDNDGRISKSYAVDGWPAFFLIDGEGNLVYDHLGEDRYRELESEIRQAVSELPDTRKLDGPPIGKDAALADCGAATPEVVLSTAIKPAADETPWQRRVVAAARDGALERGGRWRSTADGQILDQSNRDQEAFIRIYYRGAQAFAALTPGASGRSRFYVKQDGLWLHSLNAGPDVRFDEDGQSYVVADLPRLYELADNPTDEVHELDVFPASRGAGVEEFSFADRCLPLKAP